MLHISSHGNLSITDLLQLNDSCWRSYASKISSCRHHLRLSACPKSCHSTQSNFNLKPDNGEIVNFYQGWRHLGPANIDKLGLMLIAMIEVPEQCEARITTR